MELMSLRREIDGRIESHPFREKDFNITNPVVNEILKHGQVIQLTRAFIRGKRKILEISDDQL